jgi:hypothetical protein
MAELYAKRPRALDFRQSPRLKLVKLECLAGAPARRTPSSSSSSSSESGSLEIPREKRPSTTRRRSERAVQSCEAVKSHENRSVLAESVNETALLAVLRHSDDHSRRTVEPTFFSAVAATALVLPVGRVSSKTESFPCSLSQFLACRYKARPRMHLDACPCWKAEQVASRDTHRSTVNPFNKQAMQVDKLPTPSP